MIRHAGILAQSSAATTEPPPQTAKPARRNRSGVTVDKMDKKEAASSDSLSGVVNVNN